MVSVMLYPCIFCIYRSIDMFVLCVACLTEFVWRNYFWVWLKFVVECRGSVEAVLCWIDHVWSSKECVCCACDPIVYLDAPSIGFVCVCVCVCQKLFPHLIVKELDHRCLLSSCCFFV